MCSMPSRARARPTWGGVAALRRTPGRRGVHGPMGAVGIERQRKAVTLEDGAQGGHEGGHAFAAVMEFGGQQLLGGIVDAGEQGGPAVRRQGQPAMATAVEVEQLAVTRARLAAAAMPAAGLVGGDEARHLQGLLHEGIAEAHVMVATRELMEMADVEALVALAIEGEPALHFRHRRPLGRGRLPTAVEEALIPLVLQLPAQAPDAARTAPEDVGGLQPGELAREGANDDLLDLHGALHNATWIGHGHLLGGYSFHAARLERSFHVSIPGGHFTYPQHRWYSGLDAASRSEDSQRAEEEAMLTRRDILVGAVATGAIMRTRTALAKASQPGTPVSFQVPTGACDCHTHIHGDPEKFPFFSGRVYTPETALPEEMAALHRALRLQRVVIVTPSVYGTDNAATLFGMRARGTDARGVAVIDDKTPESELDAMGRAGVVGIRLNLSTGGTNDPAVGRQRLQKAIERVKSRNWHVQMNTNLTMVTATKDLVAASPVPVVFDHFANAREELGVQQPGYADLVELV